MESSSDVVAIGERVGQSATDANKSVMIGGGAGKQFNGQNHTSVLIGSGAVPKPKLAMFTLLAKKAPW